MICTGIANGNVEASKRSLNNFKSQLKFEQTFELQTYYLFKHI